MFDKQQYSGSYLSRKQIMWCGVLRIFDGIIAIVTFGTYTTDVVYEYVITFK